jgi:hypothetical protein
LSDPKPVLGRHIVDASVQESRQQNAVPDPRSTAFTNSTNHIFAENPGSEPGAT